MKLYPVMIKLADKKVSVIGGGSVAARKIRDLVECGAIVTVISPELHPDTQSLVAEHGLKVIRRSYRTGDLTDACMVVAATNNTVINETISCDAEKEKILVNCVDDPDHCNFFVPSFFRKGDLLVSVSTSGSAPSLAAQIRKDLQACVDTDTEKILDVIKRARETLKNDNDFTGLDQSGRGELIKKITSDKQLINELFAYTNNEDFKKRLMNLL